MSGNEQLGTSRDKTLIRHYIAGEKVNYHFVDTYVEYLSSKSPM